RSAYEELDGPGDWTVRSRQRGRIGDRLTERDLAEAGLGGEGGRDRQDRRRFHGSVLVADLGVVQGQQPHVVRRAGNRARTVAGTPVDLRGDVAAPGKQHCRAGRGEGHDHGTLPGRVGRAIADVRDRPVPDTDAARYLGGTGVVKDDEVEWDRKTRARARYPGDIRRRVRGRLGPVVGGQVVVGVRAALQRVVLDGQRVTRSRRVDVR